MRKASQLAPEFWLNKSLAQMNDAEWEAICDGCAKCCLHKFIADDEVDEIETTTEFNEGEEIVFTNIACQYLNTKDCACTCYEKRVKLVPECVKLTRDNLADVFYMPPSCSYRRLQEGRGLPSWHPLLNKGKKTQMHLAGMSVRNKVVSDDGVDFEDFEDYIVTWPLNDLD
ncbi:YcgN family cysteine cluster protein [Catenovulum sp. SM1970]|uniref:YcgN family cysteine cluster protein n=1 Tax=Marinifaba aquimaris TaxID=2741323 RepID=UPI001574880C|nr:YcgN family cysteine cluster protein [Marinifaba aquimaris]NTS78179.1 YcgN family cysteine cluster protein [Marinifaba aquimaris]